jgi:hypothetical protein
MKVLLEFSAGVGACLHGFALTANQTRTQPMWVACQQNGPA